MGSAPDLLNQNLWGWSPATCFFKNSAGDLVADAELEGPRVRPEEADGGGLEGQAGEGSAGLGSTDPGRETKVMALSPLLPPLSVWMVEPVGLTGLHSLQRRRLGVHRTVVGWGSPRPNRLGKRRAPSPL